MSTPSHQGPEASQIQSMFGTIAGGYDKANTVLSGGIHHIWKKRLIQWSGARAGDRVLDCATGTGDLAFAFQRKVGVTGNVVGTDFSPEMLEVAKKKKASADVAGLHFELADVTQLSFGDASFDIASISFGIRNVQDPVKGVSELGRVVRSGGRVMVLEFGQPRNTLFRKAYDFYSRHVLPTLGGWLTGQKDAYEYLEKSAAQFPCGEDFVALMKQTGRFSLVEYETLTGGIAYLYRAVVK